MDSLQLRYGYSTRVPPLYDVILRSTCPKIQNQRILDIADIPFTQVGEDEKGKHESKTAETGIFRGYKPRKYLVCAA